MFTQQNRPMNFTTPLGPDALLVKSFRGQEALSTPYRFELELLSHDPAIPFKDLLRQSVSLGIRCDDGSFRYLHGRVFRMSQAARNAEGFCVYRLEMVPWLSFLALTADCRIYQQKTVQEIVTDVFERHGYTDYEFRNLKAGQTKREYCVQYRESAFNFVSRLLEEEGIFYFFEHSAEKHLLVLADSPVEHPTMEGHPLVKCHGETGDISEEDSILELNVNESVQTLKISRRDYFFKRPSDTLEVNLELDPTYEDYDYPGRYEEYAEGDALGRARVEENQWGVHQLNGQSDCRHFVSGHYITVENFYREDVEPEQVLYAVSHEARQSVSHAMGSGRDAFRYRNSFTSFPKSVSFRPSRRARKPVVTGTQTALVVGKSGEEIYCDEYGRVKVQFPWDRLGKYNEESSCWIRVSQLWAGKGWGAIYTPRIGQEVVVDFLEGDPDRPLIVGRVYNAEQTVPYPLPSDMTKSTIKSDSTKGSGGSNEFRYEDKKGSEEIYLHAQKDFNEVVENNHSTTVHNNQTNTVDVNQTESVGGDQSMTVSGKRTHHVVKDEDVTIDQNRTKTVHKHETVTIDEGQEQTITKGRTTTITDGDTLDITGEEKVTVTGNTTITLNGTVTVTISDVRNSTLSKDDTLTVTGTLKMVGDGGVIISSNTKVDISSPKEVVIGSGSSVISMTPKEISISSAKISSTAVGTHEISGALVKIN